MEDDCVNSLGNLGEDGGLALIANVSGSDDSGDCIGEAVDSSLTPDDDAVPVASSKESARAA